MKKFSKKIIIILAIIIIVFIIGIIFLLFMGREINKEQKNTPYIDDNVNELSNIKDEKELPPKGYTASVPIFMYHFILDDYRKLSRC